MRFRVLRDVVKTFTKVGKNAVPLNKDAAEKPAAKFYITELDLANTTQGRKRQVRFIELMKQDFEEFHGKLEKKSGSVKLGQGQT